MRHINELELLGVLFGLKALCKDIQGQNIKVLTDNSTTVACINKMGSTKIGCNNKNIFCALDNCILGH